MPRAKRSDARAALQARILDLVREKPGICLGELEGLGARASTLRHHVERLEASGKVGSIPVGRRRCFFTADGPSTGEHGRMRALTQGKARRSVALALVRLGEASVEAIMAETGLSSRAVYHHLKKMVDGGAAQRSRRGVHGPTDALRTFFAEEEGGGAPTPVMLQPTEGRYGPGPGTRT